MRTRASGSIIKNLQLLWLFNESNWNSVPRNFANFADSTFIKPSNPLKIRLL